MTDDSLQGPLHGRDKRSSVIIRAAVVVADGVVVERRVRNLSLHGACVDNQNDIRKGQTVYVSMGTLDHRAAEVMWTTPQLAGLRFHLAIDPEAARKPRGSGTTVKSGWMVDVNHAYRVRG